MKIAFLFSGQGVQYPGMGQDLYTHYSESRTIYDKADALLNWDLKEVCFHDQEGLIHQTRFTQSALFTTSIAALCAAKAQGIVPDAVLGFSLGEYSALVASGILSFEDGLKLVEKRSEYMEACTKQNEGSMAAVIGLSNEEVEAVCEAIRLEGLTIVLANDNCPGQVVISGEKKAIDQAITQLKAKGARRVMPLNVSGAFHSPLMMGAANKLLNTLETIQFCRPVVPIVSNVTATYMTEDEARAYIPIHMIKGVRFRESILKLIDDGFDTFIEIGVKKTLCQFVSKINKDVRIFNIEDAQSLQYVISEIGGSNVKK